MICEDTNTGSNKYFSLVCIVVIGLCLPLIGAPKWLVLSSLIAITGISHFVSYETPAPPPTPSLFRETTSDKFDFDRNKEPDTVLRNKDGDVITRLWWIQNYYNEEEEPDEFTFLLDVNSHQKTFVINFSDRKGLRIRREF